MKVLKRISAVVLAFVLVFAFAGCHKKNEVAVKVGDYEFTSAYYMCALMNADAEAKAKVNEAKESDDTNSEEIDYYSEKIDDKSYTDWVKDTAIENLKKIATYKTLCKEVKIEVSDEDKSYVESYTDYYWNNYGYSAYYGLNGVGEETYKQYMTDAYYAGLYFDHIYGEGGNKEISSEDIKKAMNENYILADVLEASLANISEEEAASMKETFNGYLEALQNGTKTFEEIYKEHNSITDENAAAEDSSEDAPKDKYATVLGSEDTTRKSDHYNDAKDMAVGEIKLFNLEDESELVIIVKQDINADEYYLKNLDTEIRHLIADDEFEEFIKTESKKLDVEINKYAIKQFKVNKIKEPENAKADES